MSTTTPTPSDAAMAAIFELEDNGLVYATGGTSSRDHGILLEQERQRRAQLIDRHFAPLREELARLNEINRRAAMAISAACVGSHTPPTASAVLLSEMGHHIADIHNRDLRESVATLRASNDKLRAALEDYANVSQILVNIMALNTNNGYCLLQRDMAIGLKRCIAEYSALAPERKETT